MLRTLMTALSIALLALTLGCERSPASPTSVVTTVNVSNPTTTPTPTPGTTSPITCPTCPTTTCPNPALGCTGTGTPSPGTRGPEILSFGADSSRIHWGGTAVLRWEVSDPSAFVRIDPGVGSVGSVGFVVVSPSATTTYTLTARNNIATVQRQFTVLVLSGD